MEESRSHVEHPHAGIRLRPRTVDQLKDEIDALFELQHEDLNRATFLGMTSDEAKVIEERRKKITALVDQLARMKTAE